jgi:D-arabinose 1-dehydrogenase-like Zn-dependent alcohol dehydrogenase
MRAVILNDFEAEVAIEEARDPEPADDELLVRALGSSVNAIDAYEATGALTGTDYDFPVTIGTDFAGVVERIGEAVTRYRPGDEVFGFRPYAGQREGTWAELIALPETHGFLAAKPDRLDFTQAGAAPLAAVTALAALDPVEVSEGDAVLIIGGSGASAASRSSSPRAAARRSSPRASPRTRSTCEISVRPRSSIVRETSPPRCASGIRTASTRWSTWCRELLRTSIRSPRR